MILLHITLIINILFREIPCSIERFLTEENKFCLSGGFDSRSGAEKEDDILLSDNELHMRKKKWLKLLEDPNVLLCTKFDLINTSDLVHDVQIKIYGLND